MVSRMRLKGNCGCQLESHSAEGWKVPEKGTFVFAGGMLIVDGLREAEACAGFLPRAFSLKLGGRSVAESILDDCAAELRVGVSSPLSSSSLSSPISNRLSVGVSAGGGEGCWRGPRLLSMELGRERFRLLGSSSARSFRSCACRSSSKRAPSIEKSRRSLNFLRLAIRTSTKRGFSEHRKRSAKRY